MLRLVSAGAGAWPGLLGWDLAVGLVLIVRLCRGYLFIYGKPRTLFTKRGVYSSYRQRFVSGSGVPCLSEVGHLWASKRSCVCGSCICGTAVGLACLYSYYLTPCLCLCYLTNIARFYTFLSSTSYLSHWEGQGM